MYEDERSKHREALTKAVEEMKQAVGPLRQLRVVINQKSGEIQAFAKLLVAEKVGDKLGGISLLDARRIKQQVEIGEDMEVDVTPVGFGQIAARYAKQSLVEHIRRAEERL